jgi:hypothetical protein
MAGIFISYRRDDSAAITGRIFDRLSAHFGSDAVFMDIDSIPVGHDFREHIGQTLERCDVMLVVVGRRWSGPPGETSRRIDDPADLVRLELEGGLARNIPLVPVLVDGAATPSPLELPESLRGFSYRNGATIDAGKDFHPHVDRLIRDIEALIRRPAPAPKRKAPAADTAKVARGSSGEARQDRPAVADAPAERRRGVSPGVGRFLAWGGLTLVLGIAGLVLLYYAGVLAAPEAVPIYGGILLLALALVGAQCWLEQRWRRATGTPTAAAARTNVAIALALPLFAASIALVPHSETGTRGPSDAIAWAAFLLMAGGAVSLVWQLLRLTWTDRRA